MHSQLRAANLLLIVEKTLSEIEASQLVKALLGPGPWPCRKFGAGKFSETFWVQGPEEELVLRVAPPERVLQLFYEYRMMRQEPAIHERLRAETEVPVPAIVARDFSRSRIDRDFLLMRRLRGVPLSEASLGPESRARAFRDWGSYVAQIHRLTDPTNRFGYLGEHRCMEPQATWADAFREMYRKELDDIVCCRVYSESEAARYLDLLDQNLAAFHHCLESRLCHGDLWVTNLLVEPDGRVTGVIDFDRACWGDIEWDLAIAEYCGVTNRSFWEGYGDRVNTREGSAAVRRLFYLLYEHQKYIVISVSSRRNDPAGARRYADECRRIIRRFRDTGNPLS